MTPDDAKRILARLRVHFPAMLPNDERLARVAAEDWLTLLCRLPLESGLAAADLLIGTWKARDGAPKIGDWQEACRQCVARSERELYELPVRSGWMNAGESIKETMAMLASKKRPSA